MLVRRAQTAPQASEAALPVAGMLARRRPAGAPARSQVSAAVAEPEGPKREDRRASRKRRLPEAETCWSQGRTLLQSRSVSVGQEQLYGKLMAEFLEWASARRLPLDTLDQKDEAVVLQGDAMSAS